AMLTDVVQNRLRERPDLVCLGLGAQRCPESRVAPWKQRNRRGAYGRGFAFATIGARAEPRPGHLAGEAPIVEPSGFISGETRRQDFRFPSAGRRFEAFELADD